MAVTLTLPMPPSVNRYYRNVRGRTLISADGRRYRSLVIATVMAEHLQKRFECQLEVTIWVTPPDRRRRDIDNLLKALLDSLQHAGVFVDDSQIKKLTVGRLSPAAPGHVQVTVKEAA